MPGRYGRPSRSTRGATHAAPRPSRRFQILGVLAGTALIAAGAVAVASAGGGSGQSSDLTQQASDDAAGYGDADGVAREADDVARSAPREDGGERKPFAKSAPGERFVQAEVIDAAERDESDESDGETDPDAKPAATAPLPADSGEGRRIVFDITDQQVWLVEDGDQVEHTYLVSGSRYDQLPEGTYEVFSKSEEAVSWTYTETMRYMVRFHRGENSNIGFHDIPIYKESGEEAQTLSELGTPLSDGCIRQDHEDAKALWDFAPVGTQVVVVRT
jgi:lipoprotein-anchoring transpeptidase ErfK/SrfK